MITYSLLQHYWWFIISLLAGILSFLLFVQGGQTMLFSLAKNDNERTILINVLGRKWEFTFTTLVTFGGAFFASFPLFYSTSFGGAYWVWVLILLGFILQAVSYEFQSKPGNFLGKRTYQAFLFVNGLLATFLIGAAVATFFTGSDFTVNKENLTGANPIISQWGNNWHGLEALLDVRNWFLGLAIFFLARTLAALYFINRIKHEEIAQRAHKAVWYNAIPFVVFFLAFVIWTLLANGYAVDPMTGTVSLVKFKYFTNLLQMPVVLIMFLLGVVAVLFGIIATMAKANFRKGIWYSGIGTILTVCSLLLVAGYNNTAYYPSATHLQSSLTIFNSSSSFFTLKAMSIVSILIPFVALYIFFAWRSLDKKQVDLDDIESDGHAY